MKYLLPIVVAFVVVGCSGNNSPTVPASAQVAGLWSGTITITGITGGECVGGLLQRSLGQQERETLSVTQNGATLTATSTSQSSGSSCSYTGTAGASSVVLNVTSCTASDLLGITCANGARRDMRLQTAALNATVSGNSGSGTSGSTYNILAAGTQAAVGVMTVNGAFTMTRQ